MSTDTPQRDEIADWLASEQGRSAEQADEWAGFLAGLPWVYIRPVVQIAVNSRTHPATALSSAVRYSADVTFTGAARVHLERARAWVEPQRKERAVG